MVFSGKWGIIKTIVLVSINQVMMELKNEHLVAISSYNAPTHIRTSLLEGYLRDIVRTILAHPFYSSGLALRNFALFSCIQHQLKSRKTSTDKRANICS